jgi:uncharacterized protein YigE (DUF2233 family)
MRFSMAAWLLLGWLLHSSVTTSWAAKAERVSFLGTEFAVCWVDLRTDELSLYWRDDQGKPFGTFSRLRDYLAAHGRELKFAINAGIFSSNDIPLGLHVAESNVLQKLNLGDLEGGQGNFYMKPNGVFYAAGDQAGVVESRKFAELGMRPRLASQSGPLLLEQGRIHPAFRPDSRNLRVRSGVGVTQDGRVVFVLSKTSVRFHDFARLFAESLRCENALYLDGDICSICLPELGYKAEDTSTRFAGIFAITARAKALPPAAGGR